MRPHTIPSLLLVLAFVACAGDAPTALTPSANRAFTAVSTFPGIIQLPNGFAADGLSFGEGTTFYVGSDVAGAIWRGDARTGAGSLLVPQQPGRFACAIAYDARSGRLFVGGSFTGQAYVYDAVTGATLGVYQLADPAVGPTGVLDVAVLRDAVYFIDVAQPVLYRLPLGPNGTLPRQSAVQTIPYSGDYQFVPGGAFNTSGMVATPDGQWLLVNNVTTGTLYRVNPATGQTTAVNLGGASVPNGDGLALVGHTLYVAQDMPNQVVAVHLDSEFLNGAIEPALQNTALDFPTKLAAFGSSLYAVNGRFEVPIGPDVSYQVVRMSR